MCKDEVHNSRSNEIFDQGREELRYRIVCSFVLDDQRFDCCRRNACKYFHLSSRDRRETKHQSVTTNCSRSGNDHIGTVLMTDTPIVTILTPNETQYKDLIELGFDQLLCRCSRISILNGKVLKASTTFHQVCSSEFVGTIFGSMLYLTLL